MTGLWAETSDLNVPTSPNAKEALATASYLLWTLSGRRWSGWHEVTEEYVCDGFMTTCSGWIPTVQQWGTAEHYFTTTTGDPYWGHRPGQKFLFLRRRPARELLMVRRMNTGELLDLTALAIYDYAYMVGTDLSGECSSCFDPCGLEVTYKWGGPPPQLA